MEILIQPSVPFGEFLKNVLRGKYGTFDRFSAAVAFVKYSGVRHIKSELSQFLKNDGQCLFIAGIDRQGTSFEGLEALLKIIGASGDMFVNYCTDSFVTFHPKVYFFENEQNGLLLIGSGNLTEGGLYTNDEAFLLAKLDLTLGSDSEIAGQVRAAFQQWRDGNGVRISEGLLQTLLDSGLIVLESVIKEADAVEEPENVAPQSILQKRAERNPSGLFKKSVVRRAAPKATQSVTRNRKRQTTQVSASESEQTVGRALGFVMVLQNTDVGSGQKTVGSSRRSPEIFIPLAARNLHPKFWGWQELFVEDDAKPGKFDRRNVQVRIGGEIVSVNMMTWPVKHDFRLRSERLRSAGNTGDILRMEMGPLDSGFDYYVEIVPQGTTAFDHYAALCTEEVRNSAKRWGYYGF